MHRTEPPQHRWAALARPVDARYVGGVCAGLADATGLSVRLIRGAFVALTLFGHGLGVLIYVLVWALTPQTGSTTDVARRSGTPGVAAKRLRTPIPMGPAAVAQRRQELVRWFGVGLAMVAGGVLLMLSRAGMPTEVRTWAPLTVLVIGAVLGLAQLDSSERTRWLGHLGIGRWTGVLRLLTGVLLAVAGVLLVVLPRVNPAQVTTTLLAAVAVLLGTGLVLAPWGLRLWRDLEAERALRARETERAEITAHLHDSVLQTLALIQRRPDDPAEVTRLARAQERELRAWLYGGPGVGEGQPKSLREAVRQVCAEREDTEGVPIELIMVGDAPLTDHTTVLVQALREAVSNAARHGKEGVSVYLECTGDTVEVFVRDRGPGFDPSSIPMDRFGVRGSIIDRMDRHGGWADLRTAPGEGTEVILTLPVKDPEGEPEAVDATGLSHD